MTGAQINEIIATLPAFQGVSERPVLNEHCGKLNSRNQPVAIGQCHIYYVL
jgi:hypothetical protein